MTTPTTRGGLRPVTLTLRNAADEPVGECALRLALPPRSVGHPDPVDAGAWAITHPLGTPAGGTHTEVAFVDDTAADLPEHLVDDLVRQVARAMYGDRWSFHYRPERVADAVLRYGSALRERVEVTAVEVWS